MAAGGSLASMIERLFGVQEMRGLMIGLDASGRTTMLYRLVLGEIVTTIPTIGFNVETIKRSNVKMTLWDVGGCDKIRPLWRHYFQNTHFVMFFIDSRDRARLPQAVVELGKLVSEDELKNSLICVIINKQDADDAMSPAEIMSQCRFEAVLQGKTWRAFVSWWLSFNYCQPCSGKTLAGVDEIFDFVSSVRPSLKPKDDNRKEEELKPKSLLEIWLEVQDKPDDEFLHDFDNYSLTSWDHRTHLKIAWLLLSRYGRRDGMKRIFDGIKLFIENSPRTNRALTSEVKDEDAAARERRLRGTTFHETMTYFWVHMVHYAMESLRYQIQMSRSSLFHAPTSFEEFIVLNPQLSNGGLWLDYYSKPYMMSPEARNQVVLPDMISMPSVLSPIDSSSSASSSQAPSLDVDDDVFMSCFCEGRLRYWGHETFLRLIYCLLKNEGRTGQTVDKIHDSMKLNSNDYRPHVTLTYFWLQMVNYAMLNERISLGGELVENVARPSFVKARELSSFQPLIHNQMLYLDFYSRPIIDSAEAEDNFVLPDLQQLPAKIIRSEEASGGFLRGLLSFW